MKNLIVIPTVIATLALSACGGGTPSLEDDVDDVWHNYMTESDREYSCAAYLAESEKELMQQFTVESGISQERAEAMYQNRVEEC